MSEQHGNQATATLEERAGGAAALLKVPAVAAFLGISERKLWSLTNCGDIPAVRIGRSVRYDPRDVEAFAARQKKGLSK